MESKLGTAWFWGVGVPIWITPSLGRGGVAATRKWPGPEAKL